MMHVDTNKPCPVCGKPFETESVRMFSSALESHLKNMRDKAHSDYRDKEMVELHAIYCDCERCKPA